MEYHRPDSLAEACELLATLDEAVPLAGGTDVVVDLRRRVAQPRHVVSLRDLDELRGIALQEGALRIGALATPAGLAASDAVREARPELLDCVEVFAGPQVRARATVGGNLCTAASCGDLPPLLIALGATVSLAGRDGTREMPLHDFFAGGRETVLAKGELLTAVTLPPRRPGEGAAYKAFGLRARSFITAAGVAAAVYAGGRVRLGLGAVAPTPLLVDTSVADAAAAAREAARPIADVRGTAEHRLELVEVLARRALHRAAERARA